jgi:hypothetical protein
MKAIENWLKFNRQEIIMKRLVLFLMVVVSIDVVCRELVWVNRIADDTSGAPMANVFAMIAGMGMIATSIPCLVCLIAIVYTLWTRYEKRARRNKKNGRLCAGQ